jgi:hypothetical protein
MPAPSERTWDLDGSTTEIDDTLNIGAAFMMMALGQLVLLFTFWFSVWPHAFGIPRDVRIVTMLGGFFTAAAVLGIYWGLQQLLEQTTERA